jgi:phosphoribosylamine---glycine ligase
MRVLVFDPPGLGLDFALRCMGDGHDVKHFIRQTEKTRNIARGFTSVVEDHRAWLRWADLIFVTDNTRYLRDLDSHCRDVPGTVVGATVASATWELDREIGAQILKKAGIDVPPYRMFTNYDDAIAYTKKCDCRLVSKPCGDNTDTKALSYCANSPEDMVYMLQRWKKLGHSGKFIMQDFIPGCEMAVGGWFGPHGFNSQYCENWEFKKLMDGDMGVATGEQGTVLRYVKSSKLARKVMLPIEKALQATGHTGYIDVNCIVDDKGKPWPLEFTMRPGWPTFNIQQALNTGDTAQWLKDLADGTDAANWQLDTPAIGVVVSIPDYPYSHLTKKEVTGVPVYGLTPGLWKYFHPCEMMLAPKVPQKVAGQLVELPCPASAGDYVYVMTATGETIKDAKDRAYRRLKRLTMPNSPMHRTDIGDRLRQQLPGLQQHGYAAEMRFSQPPT